MKYKVTIQMTTRTFDTYEEAQLYFKLTFIPGLVWRFEKVDANGVVFAD